MTMMLVVVEEVVIETVLAADRKNRVMMLYCYCYGAPSVAGFVAGCLVNL